MTEILRYCLGLAMSRNPGLRLHAFVASTNHTHCVVSDDPISSRLPEALGLQHSLSARALNCHYGEGENFWSPGSYGNVEIVLPGETDASVFHDPAAPSPVDLMHDALEQQLLYLWTNVVKDGLVDRPERWPGLIFLPEDFGTTVTVSKPSGAFFGGQRPIDRLPNDPVALRRYRRRVRRIRESQRRRERARDRARGRTERRSRQLARERARRASSDARGRVPRSPRTTLPDTVTFTVHPPPGYEDWPIGDVRAHFRRLLDARLTEIHAEREAMGGLPWMGVGAILAQSPFQSAGDVSPNFALNPRLACRAMRPRLARIRALIAWREAYREAYLAWRSGDRTVEFPWGSYGLPRFHGARVAGPSRSPPGQAA